MLKLINHTDSQAPQLMLLGLFFWQEVFNNMYVQIFLLELGQSYKRSLQKNIC